MKKANSESWIWQHQIKTISHKKKLSVSKTLVKLNSLSVCDIILTFFRIFSTASIYFLYSECAFNKYAAGLHLIFKNLNIPWTNFKIKHVLSTSSVNWPSYQTRTTISEKVLSRQKNKEQKCFPGKIFLFHCSNLLLPSWFQCPYCNPSYLKLASRILNPRWEQQNAAKKQKLLPCKMSVVTFHF